MRFRQVGCVPRHILGGEDFRAALKSQDDAVVVLTSEQAKKIVSGRLDAVGTFERKQAKEIVSGRLDAVGTFERNQPKSAIIGYGKALTTELLPFSSRRVEIVSLSVEEKVSRKFMADLWNLVLQDDRVEWKIFEAYCRALMTIEPGRSFLRRPCCGKPAQKRCKKSNVVVGDVTRFD